MAPSPESLAALKRHFLGGLSEPRSLPLAPEPCGRLLLAGGTPWGRREFFVDFGRVETPGEQRRLLRLTNLGPEPLVLRALSSDSWLEPRWYACTGDATLEPVATTELEVIARYDLGRDATLIGAIRLVAAVDGGASTLSRFSVCLEARHAQPLGHYEFQGRTEPVPFHFDFLDPAAATAPPRPYFVSIANLTETPVIVSCSDLPDWLVFAVDGYQRSGPIAGPFFERAAPFRVEVRPQAGRLAGGPRQSRLVLCTNDGRPAWQRIELELSAGHGAG
jgi:hypothetical protein